MALAILFGLTGFGTHASQAQSFNVVHAFTGGSDGAEPYAGLTMDGAGNFYGTTSSGGNGFGTVYKLAPSGSGWTLTTLYEFAEWEWNNGVYPESRVLIGSDGSLYGTTNHGGGTECAGIGCGTVFKLSNSHGGWTITVLHRFTGTGGMDGAYPRGDLIFDSAGNLYGTTQIGGLPNVCSDPHGGEPDGCGTAYKLVQSGGSWTETVLHRFADGSDGAILYAGLTPDGAGNFYSTTSSGGSNDCGTVFQLTPLGSGWTKNILYNFQCQSDGRGPSTGVIFDAGGNLYGATEFGGTGGQGGTVFELKPSGGNWAHTVLYNFSGNAGPFGNLLLDAGGNLYGTTVQDGIHVVGSAFELTPSGGSWTYTSLHDFTGGSDGGLPMSNLAFDTSGNLFGTTLGGGTSGGGVVFEISVGGCPTITLSPPTLPNGTVGTPYSQTITASGGTGPYTFAVSSGTLPAGLTLTSGGLLSGTPTVAGTSNFNIRATDAHLCTGIRSYSITITGICPPITLSPPTLPSGMVGTPYSQTITASGGTGPYTFTVSVGTLPAGLTLSTGGLISGTPTAAGTSNFTIRATDTHLCTGTSSYSITVTSGVGALLSTLTPCRVVDTRVNLNGFGLALQPFETRDFDVAGVCGIPANSVAISANLTVTNVGAPGEVVVFPADVLRPNTSTLSFRAGLTRANNDIVSFSQSSATFSVFNNSAATVDFILDVNGFFR